MAIISGNDGVIKVGSDTVGRIRQFDLVRSGDVIETTAMGDADRTYVAGKKTGTVTMLAVFDDTDAGQLAMKDASAAVDLDLMPEGNTSSALKIECSGFVTETTLASVHDGIAERNITVQISGPITDGTVQ